MIMVLIGIEALSRCRVTALWPPGEGFFLFLRPIMVWRSILCTAFTSFRWSYI